MNFKGLVDTLSQLFHRKRIRTCYCMSSNAQDWRQDMDERVWSICTNDERKMSLERTSRVVIKNEDLFNNLNIPEQPKKMGKSVNDFLFRMEYPLLSARNNKFPEQGGGPKRPGLLQVEPIGLQRPPKSIKIKNQKHVIIKSNLRQRDLVFASTSNESSEYYDDRGSVFGGLTSDSSDRNSCARYCISILGSSDREFGGEEGAKPFAGVNDDDSVSNAQIHREGLVEKISRRPVWSSDDDDLQEGVFSPGLLSPFDSDHVKRSPLGENENFLHLIVANKN